MKQLTQWTLRIILAIILSNLAIMPMLAQDEEEETEELPVIPYVSTSGGVERFNVPIPAGWENIGTDKQPHLITDVAEAEIYIVAIAAENEAAGRTAAIQQIVPDFTDDTPRTTGTLNMDGNIWTQEAFDLADNQTMSVFSMMQDDVEYAMIFLDQSAENRLYLIATRPEPTSVENGIQAALAQLFGDTAPGDDPENSETVTLSNGDWLKHEYAEVNGEPVSVIVQLRGNTTFTIIQHGEGDAIDTVNKAFYTVLFGFFITRIRAAT